jgi:hypothetical protein
MPLKLYRLKNKFINEIHLTWGKKYIFSLVRSEENGWMEIFSRKICWTKNPLFSVRNGYKKSIKLKNYYITLR